MFYATIATHRNSFSQGQHALNAKLAAWAAQSTRNLASPAVRASQDEDAFTLQLDVPGLGKAELSIEIEGQVVRINSKEGAARSVRYSYELPQAVVVAQSAARLDNGVLTLTLAKEAPVNQAVELAIS